MVNERYGIMEWAQVNIEFFYLKKKSMILFSQVRENLAKRRARLLGHTFIQGGSEREIMEGEVR